MRNMDSLPPGRPQLKKDGYFYKATAAELGIGGGDELHKPFAATRSILPPEPYEIVSPMSMRPIF